MARHRDEWRAALVLGVLTACGGPPRPIVSAAPAGIDAPLASDPDPKTNQFARPPLAEHWGSLAETKPGSCGPFQFDATEKAFLYGQSLCTKDGCKGLGGYVVGWLTPGPTVGMPGSSED